MMKFQDTSIIARCSLGLAILAFVTHTIGFASPFWYYFVTDHGGLFQLCGSAGCEKTGNSRYLLQMSSGWWRAIQSLEGFGFFAGLACLVCVVRYVLFRNDDSRLKTASWILSFSAGLLALVGVAVFAGKTQDTWIWSRYAYMEGGIDWAFGLTVTGGVFYLATGVTVLLDGFLII